MIWRANGPCVKQWEQPLMTGGHLINFKMFALLFFCPQALIIRFLIALAQIALTIPKRTSVFIRSLMNKQKRMISNRWESLKKSTCPNQRLAGHVMESCSPLEQVHINSWQPPHLPHDSSLCGDYWDPRGVGGLRGCGHRGCRLQHEHLCLPLGLRSLLQDALWRVQHSHRVTRLVKKLGYKVCLTEMIIWWIQNLICTLYASLLIFSIYHINLSNEK